MIDSNSQFFATLTAVGEAKQANATALGIPWTFKEMAVGDANGTDPVPDKTQTKLINEWRRAPVNQVRTDPANPNVIITEQVIPPDVGGHWIREIGLFDADGDLVAVANCAPTFKPLLAQGTGKTQIIRMNFIVSNTAQIVLKIDPSVVLATRQYVDDSLATALPANKAAGTYRQVTIDKRGVVLSGTNPTTVAGYGITDAYTKPETTAAIQEAVAALVASAPGALDTLKELADALGNDPNFATTMTNAIAAKASKGELNTAVSNLLPKAGGTVSGSIVLNNGSTDSPEISWQTPGFDIRADAVGKGLRFFAVNDGVTTFPLVLDVLNRSVSIFGNNAWHAGNFNPGDKADKAELTTCVKKGQVLEPGGSPVFMNSDTGSISATPNYSGGLEARGSGSGAAVLALHRPSRFITYLGLDTDNQLKIGGGSMGAVAHTIFHSGNFDPNTYQGRVGIQGASKNLIGRANGTNTVATYTADELIVGNAAGTYRTLRPVNVSPSLAGAGANGLDVGVSVPNAWYSVWIIWNGSGAAGLFSLDATAPTLPGGYTHLARVGWVRTDGNRNIVSYTQTGNSWRYKSFGNKDNAVAPTLAAGAAGDPHVPTLVAVSISHAVPPTASQIFVIANSLTTAAFLIAHPNPYCGGYDHRTNPPQITQSVSVSGGAYATSTLMTIESSNIYWANNTARAFLVCLGFEDNL